MNYQRIRITYYVRGKEYYTEQSVLPETRELIISRRMEEIIRAHKITERDIVVQEVLV